MNEVIIKTDNDFLIIRKDYVERVWRVITSVSRSYYVRTVGGNEYKIRNYDYNRIRFMMMDAYNA